MSERISRVIGHTLIILKTLPNPTHRNLLGRMVVLSRELPDLLNLPLPQMMAQLTPSASTEAVNNRSEWSSLSPDYVRQLADAVAAWHIRSPLGICLRRSLLRYYFLRELGVPVCIVFGARLKNSQEGDGLGGHAWLTLDGTPYYETPEDYRYFTAMYVYPEESSPAGHR